MVKEFLVRYALELVCTGLVTNTVYMIKEIRKFAKKLEENDKNNDRRSRTILRFEILSICRNCQERGYTYPDELTTLETMYSDYKALNGNGVVDKQYDKIKALPTVHEYKKKLKRNN